MTDSQTLEALMQLAMAGDQQAYAALLQASVRLLRPFLSRRLNSASEVDDVIQEILLSVHKARHTYDGQRPYKPWLYAIARFRLQDHLRGHYADQLYHAEELTEQGEAHNIAQPDVTGSGFSYESIREEVDKLPERQATILRMMHLEGFSAKEVAQRLGANESAIKVAAHRAYKLLRNLVNRHE